MKKIKDLYLKEHNSDWEGEDGEYAPVEFNLFLVGSKILENQKYRIFFKLKNLFFEHYSNPWSIYTEIKTLGKGAYGVIKKACLKSAINDYEVKLIDFGCSKF